MAKEPGLEFGPRWKEAFLTVEVESMETDEFVAALQPWTLEPATDNPLVAQLALINLSDVETGRLLMDLVIYKRLISLVRRGAEAEAQLLSLCASLKRMCDSKPATLGAILVGGLDEIAAICSFFETTHSPWRPGSGEVMRTLRASKHGAMGLVRSAVNQSTHWRNLEAKCWQMDLAADTFLPAREQAMRQLGADVVDLSAVRDIMALMPGWMDSVGVDNLSDIIAALQRVFESEMEVVKTNAAPDIVDKAKLLVSTLTFGTELQIPCCAALLEESAKLAQQAKTAQSKKEATDLLHALQNEDFLQKFSVLHLSRSSSHNWARFLSLGMLSNSYQKKFRIPRFRAPDIGYGEMCLKGGEAFRYHVLVPEDWRAGATVSKKQITLLEDFLRLCDLSRQTVEAMPDIVKVLTTVLEAVAKLLRVGGNIGLATQLVHKVMLLQVTLPENLRTGCGALENLCQLAESMDPLVASFSDLGAALSSEKVVKWARAEQQAVVYMLSRLTAAQNHNNSLPELTEHIAWQLDVAQKFKEKVQQAVLSACAAELKNAVATLESHMEPALTWGVNVQLSASWADVQKASKILFGEEFATKVKSFYKKALQEHTSNSS
eukprot:6492428-Amphidinium_carterae.2